MTNDNQDALWCADDMDQFLLTVPAHPLCTDAAAHLRRLVAENEAKDALLRQALETLENLQGGCTDSDDGTVEALTIWCPEIIDAIRQHLEGRA